MPSRLVRQSWEATVCRFGDLPTQISVHWDLNNASLPQSFGLEKLPAFQKLFCPYTSHAEWLGQMTVTKAALARYLPRDNDCAVRLGKETAPVRFAEDCENRTLRHCRKVHEPGVASHKTG